MKYIIEIPSKADFVTALYMEDGLPVMYTSNKIDDLEPYIEPDKKVFEDEVWELAGKIQKMTCEQMHEVFGITASNYDYFCNEISYQEAKNKYEKWEKWKNELHVGDEVLNRLGKPYIIYEIKNDSAYGIMFDEYPLSQECFSIYDTNKKTGRHFPEIAELLKKMRGEK